MNKNKDAFTDALQVASNIQTNTQSTKQQTIVISNGDTVKLGQKNTKYHNPLYIFVIKRFRNLLNTFYIKPIQI